VASQAFRGLEVQAPQPVAVQAYREMAAWADQIGQVMTARATGVVIGQTLQCLRALRPLQAPEALRVS
jgi:hypothetical protein